MGKYSDLFLAGILARADDSASLSKSKPRSELKNRAAFYRKREWPFHLAYRRAVTERLVTRFTFPTSPVYGSAFESRAKVRGFVERNMGRYKKGDRVIPSIGFRVKARSAAALLDRRTMMTRSRAGSVSLCRKFREYSRNLNAPCRTLETPLAPQLKLSPGEMNGVRQPATSHFEGPKYR